jgi:hypothetical protein
MTDPTSTPSPATNDTNYLTIALAVGIPSSAVILTLVVLISVMFYLTCKTPTRDEEAMHIRSRFQGLSLAQQRSSKTRRERRGVTGRRESSVSGHFNARVSRTPSSLSATARTNPFGLQEWQIRMYGGSGPRGTQRGGEGSPDTEETDISGDDTSQRKGSGPPIGAINPLLIRGQDHDPGYDTPPQKRRLHKPHPLTPPHTSHKSHPHKGPTQRGQNLRPSPEEKDDEEHTSSDDSMNPYD